MPQSRKQPPRPSAVDAQRRAREALATHSGGQVEIHGDSLPEAPISDHFTLHFIEELIPGDHELLAEIPGAEPVNVQVRVAGVPVGRITVSEHQWARIWRAIVQATPSFERQGIAPLRTGRFR